MLLNNCCLKNENFIQIYISNIYTKYSKQINEQGSYYLRG